MMLQMYGDNQNPPPIIHTFTLTLALEKLSVKGESKVQ